MEWLTGYIVKICAAALISFVVDMLLPEGNIKRTARFCASLVITIIICAPLINLFTQQQTVITPPDENHSVPDEYQIKQSVEKAITQLIKTVDGFNEAQVTVTLSDGNPYSVEIYKNQNGAPINKLNEQKIIELISVLYKIDENKIYIRE